MIFMQSGKSCASVPPPSVAFVNPFRLNGGGFDVAKRAAASRRSILNPAVEEQRGVRPFSTTDHTDRQDEEDKRGRLGARLI